MSASSERVRRGAAWPRPAGAVLCACEALVGVAFVATRRAGLSPDVDMPFYFAVIAGALACWLFGGALLLHAAVRGGRHFWLGFATVCAGLLGYFGSILGPAMPT